MELFRTGVRFWSRFYLVLIPAVVFLLFRDAVIDFYFEHRAPAFHYTLQYNLVDWGLKLLWPPLIFAACSWMFAQPRVRRFFLIPTFTFAFAALHICIHHLLVNSILTFGRLSWSAMLVSVLITFWYALWLQQERQDNTLRSERLESQLRQVELMNVRSQIDPPAVFKTLHRATELLGNFREEADLLLADLAVHLRNVLRTSAEYLQSSPREQNEHELMRPVEVRKWLTLISGAWVAIGFLMAGCLLLDDLYVWHVHALDWKKVVSIWMSWVGVGLLTPFIFWMGRKYPLSPPRTVNFLMHFAGCFVFWFLIAFPLWLFRYGWHTTISSFGEFLGNGLAMGFKIDVYGAVLIAVTLIEHMRRKGEEEIRSAQLENSLLQAEMLTLRMQLQPHFLFNALNSVIELIHEDPEKARTLLSRLEEFLKITLAEQATPEITLGKELDFVNCYFDMQKVRFPKRLSVKMEIDPATMDCSVPTLVLQPLIENAVRHGISHSSEPGEISIRSEKQNGTLRLKVRDTGPGLSTTGSGKEGIGLANTRRRLQQMYGSDYKLDITNDPAGGLQVLLELPNRL